MWSVMMVGMMTPSAAPMVLLFAAVNRRERDKGAPFVASGVFAAGYLAMWCGFSLAAVVLQWALQQAALLSPMMASRSTALSGALLIAAGLYQLTPLKHACLEHCRMPVHFLSRHWRRGTGGAFVMGLHHGAYCVGCCWVLMALLFTAGIMNLLWVAVIAVFVLIEKTAPFGMVTGRITAALLIAAGVWAII
jgi:predicted metal-binding membrane protein